MFHDLSSTKKSEAVQSSRFKVQRPCPKLGTRNSEASRCRGGPACPPSERATVLQQTRDRHLVALRDIHVDLDSSLPCWNDALNGFPLNRQVPAWISKYLTAISCSTGPSHFSRRPWHRPLRTSAALSGPRLRTQSGSPRASRRCRSFLSPH